MSEIRDILLKNGFEQVKTYIQSGNIIVSTLLSKAETTAAIQQLILQHFQLTIDLFVWDNLQLADALANNPFADDLPGNKIFFTILSNTPENDRINVLKSIDLGEEEFYIKNNVCYFYLPTGMAKSKLSNNFIESKLQVKSTGRNRNTMQHIFQMMNQP